ncbi:hypothetical protein ACLKA6_003515 [Drosophila palustris]
MHLLGGLDAAVSSDKRTSICGNIKGSGSGSGRGIKQSFTMEFALESNQKRSSKGHRRPTTPNSVSAEDRDVDK